MWLNHFNALTLESPLTIQAISKYRSRTKICLVWEYIYVSSSSLKMEGTVLALSSLPYKRTFHSIYWIQCSPVLKLHYFGLRYFVNISWIIQYTWISVDMNVCWSENYAFFRHRVLSFLYRKGVFISRENGFLF